MSFSKDDVYETEGDNKSLLIKRNKSIENRYSTESTNSIRSTVIKKSIDRLITLEEIEEILSSFLKEDSSEKLKQIVNEIAEVEYNFCLKLRSISQDYPEFIRNNSPKNKDLLKEYPIIDEIAEALSQILNVHHVLLEHFTNLLMNWKNSSPNLASILLKDGHYLKICSVFIRRKKDIGDIYRKALLENEKLSELTKLYEENMLNSKNPNSQISNGFSGKKGVTVLLELDSVHQNLVRYALLMERYSKAIDQTQYPEEYDASLKAIKLVKNLANQVNVDLKDEENSLKMLELNKKFHGKYSIIDPCRKFIYEGILIKQARRDKLQRYLVLFNDILIVCNCSLIGKDLDPSKIRVYNVENYEVKIKDHIDYENQFELMTEEKSTAFICPNRKQRDVWVAKLREAKENIVHAKDSRLKLIKRTNPDIQTGDHYDGILYKAVWIPDEKSNVCLMPNCGVELRVLRRHHCRLCGFLICSSCTGEAPIPKTRDADPESTNVYKVCPQCYHDIQKEFGHVYKAKKFKPPKNHHLRKTTNITLEKISILERNKTGEIKRWVDYSNLNILSVFKAEFDFEPYKKIDLDKKSYAITIEENELLGAIFTIVNLENKDELYKFRVEHERKIEKFKLLFKEKLLD
uniref:FYVE-type domain-containing protein n=1 Tax=Strongyloides papillosus TaxID=174720 RepID=A0A0N5BUC7_STREA